MRGAQPASDIWYCWFLYIKKGDLAVIIGLPSFSPLFHWFTSDLDWPHALSAIVFRARIREMRTGFPVTNCTHSITSGYQG
jgi:hypothetical protein